MAGSSQEPQAFDNAERQFVQAFVHPGKRGRYLELLSTKRGRGRFISDLAHHLELHPASVLPISPSEQTPSLIARRLRSLGAQEQCYLFSESSSLDRAVLPLADALEQVVGGQMGTIVYCNRGLAYFEPEGPGGRLILFRQPRHP